MEIGFPHDDLQESRRKLRGEGELRECPLVEMERDKGASMLAPGFAGVERRVFMTLS